jgi:hypothetical protein
MSEKEKAKSEIQIMRDAFEDMKGHQPRSDQELNEWLANGGVNLAFALGREDAVVTTARSRIL